jgi:TRAP-type C4-dicarboxylate transport system permease small subunit
MAPSSVVETLAKWLATLGGVALCAIIIVTLLSVAGRSLIAIGLAPIQGDFELIEAATAFAVFAFLPWCQLKRGHVSVDIATRFLGPRTNLFIDAVADSLMLAFTLLITWRHLAGMIDKKMNGETTFILQFPVWWSYAAGMAGLAVLVIVSAYCFQRSWTKLFAARGPDRAENGSAP